MLKYILNGWDPQSFYTFVLFVISEWYIMSSHYDLIIYEDFVYEPS